VQFPLINLYKPVTKRGRTRDERTDTFEVLLGQTEIDEIRKHLAHDWNKGVTKVESCWDGQVKRRYTVEDGKIVKGVHFAPTDYLCERRLPLRIPKES
jgi:hypothetical protein